MKPKPWNPSRKDRRVLLALLSGATNLGAITVSRAAQVGAGYVHVSLARLESFGWVTREWTDYSPDRRCLYSLTPMGRERAMLRLGLRMGGR